MSETIKHESHQPGTEACPTCSSSTTFTFIGEQTWPEAVAAKLNMPPVVTMWRCDDCHTSLTVPKTG